jgi:aspartyl-tRNA(Asn)/glutamyl-tRNA(Gln) amidotransferase subunit C
MAAELTHVLDHIEKIRELDLENVPPTSHVVDVVNVMRTDEPWPCLTQEEALDQAPEPVDGFFGVPSPGSA